MIQLDEPKWDSENATELRTFLRSGTGQRTLANLVYMRPGFMSSTAHPHKSFAGSREIHGYEQAVKTLLELTEADPKQLSAETRDAAGSYPDLDDESKWQSEIPA